LPSNDTLARAATLVALTGLLMAAPARALDPQKSQPAAAQQAQNPQQAGAQQGAGGDGGARPKAASMVIEEASTSAEAPPPAPVGDERRAIGEYVRDHLREITNCYQKRLEDRPTLKGRLVARFDIGPSGKVIGATTDGMNDRDLAICVVKVVRGWEFDKPASGGKLRVAYPFSFEPKPSQ
jgi:outer membrane biosynthesis protein TonB